MKPCYITRVNIRFPTAVYYIVRNKQHLKFVNLKSFKQFPMSYLSRITIDPQICHGKPCIRGMRWPIEVIIDMLGSGMSMEEILQDHPELQREDVLASLQYAKLSLSGNNIQEVA